MHTRYIYYNMVIHDFLENFTIDFRADITAKQELWIVFLVEF